jgi:glutathione-regulated potassium-efflux system ancillary protein KefG
MTEPVGSARIVVIFAHPAVERARVSPALLAAAGAVGNVQIRDLYELYPDTTIDVSAEQAALTAHDLIVLQFPLHWYSVPALLKEWLDLVLTHNWAYGARGHALRGKSCVCALSTGGGADAYQADGANRFTIEEFLRPLEQTAMLCGMRWHKPFVAYGAAVIGQAALASEAARYGAWLTRLTGSLPGNP